MVKRMKRDTTLLTSAVEFLVEAFSNYETHKPRFAIVHAVTSAELVLKERLARIHPNLIFQKIDASDFTKEQTVPLRTLALGQTTLALESEAQQRKRDLAAEAQNIEALGQMTGDLAHDFNNVLIIVSGLALLLQRLGER